MSTKNTTIERDISQKQRDALPESDFAGPGTSFPITDQAHLDAAVKDLGRESPEEQASIKARIKEIAKRKGLSLPKSWQDEDSTEERMAGATTTDQPTTFNLYVPFTRVSPDDERREIIGIATKEVLDSHGTIISYEASKKAFERWIGNIREQHDSKKAIGKAVQWTPDDENKQIFVRAYISRSADGENTWTKIKEGILTGFSIAGVNAKYKTIQRDSKSVPFIDEYDMPEMSIVDNPSCPVGPVAIMRADGMTDVLATDEELTEVFQRTQTTEQTPPAPPVEQPAEIERKNVAISADNRGKIHTSRDALTSMCADAGCTDCQALMNFAGGGSDTSDEDAGMEERVAGIIDRAMAPVYQRMNAYLGEFARRQTDTTALADTISRVVAMVEALPNAQSFDEVRSEIGIVKDQVERIAKTPLPGGPHTGRTASTKTLATDGPSSSATEAEQTPEIMRQLARSGVTLSPQQSAMVVAGNLKRM